jgi:hypothetical protein
MLTSLSKVIEKIHWKHWLFLFLLSQSIYVLMLTITIPKISTEAGGMRIFDMMPLGYTYHYAISFLARLSEHGYHLYKYVQIPLDIFFPIFSFGAGFCMLILLLRFYRSLRREKKSKYDLFLQWIGLFLSFLAMLCDYLENMMIVTMLSFKENVSTIIVSVANIFTMIKSMSTTIFYSICILIVMSICVRWVQNKVREKKTIGKLRYSREEKSTIEDSDPR